MLRKRKIGILRMSSKESPIALGLASVVRMQAPR